MRGREVVTLWKCLLVAILLALGLFVVSMAHRAIYCDTHSVAPWMPCP